MKKSRGEDLCQLSELGCRPELDHSALLTFTAEIYEPETSAVRLPEATGFELMYIAGA